MAFFTSSQGTSQKKGSSFFTSPYDTAKTQKSIDNAKTRIQDAGYTAKDADQRNDFEKFTNLPQGQNWFFDTLEILGRPGAAVKNIIDKTGIDKSEDAASAAWKGFSGQDKVSGAEIAEKLGAGEAAEKIGLNAKATKFFTGLALDIGTDPLTYVPGGVLLKGAKGASKLATAPIKAGYNALESAAPALKTLRETRIDPVLESGKDALGYMFNSKYRIDDTLEGNKSRALDDLAQKTDNSRSYMQEGNLLNLGNLAKSAGGIEKGVDAGRIVEAPLKQFEDAKAYQFPDGSRVTENKSDLLNVIRGNKDSIQNISKGINPKKREYGSAVTDLVKGLDETDVQIRKLYTGLERQAGKELNKETRTNLRESAKELERLDSQLNNFGQNEASLLRNFKKVVRDNHESNFDLVKAVRQAAPNGIKGVDRANVPASLQNLIREGGKGIDEVANELGYSYADDLVRDLSKVSGMPRKLDNDTLESLAKKEMERSGALKQLASSKKELEATRSTIRSSVKDLRRNNKTNVVKASEKAFADIAENPQYLDLTTQRNAIKNQLDSTRSESKQVRQTELDRIRELEKGNDALKGSLKNPVTIQKELQRPVRELSDDPKIKEAAEKLIQSSESIRKFAADNGIEIKDMEGYMTHIWSQEERNARKIKKPKKIDQGSFGTGNPNKSILKQRELMGSAEDVNEKVGRKFFEPNAFFASAIGQKRLIDYVHAVNFRRQVLSDTDFAVKYTKGMDIPRNAEVIDTNNYKFLKETGDELDGIVPAEQIGGQYVVTKAAKQLLDRYQKLNTDEGTKRFFQVYDGLQSFWKRAALFSLGYHARNQAGAMFNNYVGGMNEIELLKYTKDGFQEVAKALGGQESKMFNEYRQQGLSSSALSKVEFAKYGEEPESAIQKTVKNLSKDKKGQVTQRLNPLNGFQTSQEVGNFFDQANRFAIYKWARETKKMSPEQAAAKVRETQFDYTQTTPFERNVAARVLPFYRWMKNNIPFQIRQFVDDPRKYEYFNKIRLNAQEVVGLDEENIPDYMKESFAIPFSGEGGKGKMIGLNFPLGDLAKLSRPGKTIVDSVSPLIKTLPEIWTNYNTFRGKKIENFEGQQKQYEVFGKEFGIPIKAAYGIEQATGQIGRGLSGFFTKPESVDQDSKNRLPTLGISSLTKDFDVKKYEYYEKLNELRQLQDLMLFIEQQTGGKPRTLAEIKRD